MDRAAGKEGGTSTYPGVVNYNAHDNPDPVRHAGQTYKNLDGTTTTMTADQVPDIVIIALGVNDFNNMPASGNTLDGSYKISINNFGEQTLEKVDGVSTSDVSGYITNPYIPYCLQNQRNNTHYSNFFIIDDNKNHANYKNIFNNRFGSLLFTYIGKNIFKNTQFFVCGLPYCGNENDKTNWGNPNNIVNARHTYNLVMKDITNYYQASFIDLESLSKTQVNYSLYCCDNAATHPNKRGMELVANRVEQTIRDQYVIPASA